MSSTPAPVKSTPAPSTLPAAVGNHEDSHASQKHSTAVVTTGAITTALYDEATKSYLPSQYLLSITQSILSILESKTYRRTLALCITREERVRLEALRRQVWFGDAPLSKEEEEREKQRCAEEHRRATEEASRPSGAEKHTGLVPPGAVLSVTGTMDTAHLVKPPRHWYDFSGRLEWNAWVKLRGTFPSASSAPVTPSFFNQRSAAETLCNEFLDLVERHRRDPRVGGQLMPLVHAAQSRAYFQMLSSNMLHRKSTSLGEGDTGRGGVTASLLARKFFPTLASPSSSTLTKGLLNPTLPVVFHVKAWQFDPAAVALLWVCRTFGLPATFEFLPLPTSSSALGTDEGGVLEESQIPFLATLTVAAGPERCAEVRSPAAAFSLLADHLLAPYPYLVGESPRQLPPLGRAEHSSRPRAVGAAPSTARPSGLGQKCQTKERAQWMDELAQVTTLLRTPLLQLLADGKEAEEVRLYELTTTAAAAAPTAARETMKRSVEASAAVPAEKTKLSTTDTDGKNTPMAAPAPVTSVRRYSDLNTLLQRRTKLLRDTAAKFHCLESFFVEQATNFIHHHKSYTNNNNNNNNSNNTNRNATTTPYDTPDERVNSASSRTTNAAGGSALWKLLPPSLSPFPAAQRRAALRQLTAYWNSTSHRPVTLVEVYLATCGYILATHPYCADIYPLDIEGSTMAVPTSMEAVNPNPKSSQLEAAAGDHHANRGAAVISTSVAGSPLRIPRLYGVKKRACRERILHVLQLEERFARLHRQLPLRFHTVAAPPPPPSSASDEKGRGVLPVTRPIPLSSGLVGQLLEARLMTCTEDFTPKPGPPSFWRTPAFALLAHTLSRAWKRADSQVPGFPSLLVHVQAEVERHRPSSSSPPHDPSHATPSRWDRLKERYHTAANTGNRGMPAATRSRPVVATGSTAVPVTQVNSPAVSRL